MAVETRGYWVDAVPGVGVEVVDMFDQGQDEYSIGLTQIGTSRSGSGAQETYMGKTGAGRLQITEEGDTVNDTQRFRSYSTTVAWTKYTQSIDVTREQIEDRTFTSQLDEVRDLSIQANITQDEAFVEVFNDGFTGTGEATSNGYSIQNYGDGEELFSTVHPTQVPGASTQSNASSTSIPFNHDNLETGLVALIEQASDDGKPMTLMGRPTVLVPPALQKEAIEITQSQLDPSTANNAINVYRNGMGTDMATSTFLSGTFNGSDTAWHVVIPQRNKIVHFVRQAPRPTQDVNIKNEVVTYVISARFKEAVLDWRRTWASKGDNSTYSS